MSWIKSRRIDLWPYTRGTPPVPTPVNYGTNVTVAQQFPVGMRTLAPMVLQTTAPRIDTRVNYGTSISIRQEFPLARMTMPARLDFYPPLNNPTKVPFVNYIQTRQEFPTARMAMPGVFSWRQPTNPPSTITYVNSIMQRQERPLTALPIVAGWQLPTTPTDTLNNWLFVRQEYPLAAMTSRAVTGPGITAAASLAFTGTGAQTADGGFGASQSFASCSIGSATSGDTIVVFVGSGFLAAGDKTVTVSGSVCTKRAESADDATSWHTVSGITSAAPTIIVSGSVALGLVGIAYGWVNGTGHDYTGTPTYHETDSAADPQTVTGTVPANGVSVVGISVSVSGQLPASWANATRAASCEAEFTTGNTLTVACASTVTTGSQSPAASGTGGGNGFGFAAASMAMLPIAP